MSTQHSGAGSLRLRASLAAILGTATLFAWSPMTSAAAPAPAAAAATTDDDAEDAVLDEVQVTGSRIIRRDTQSNSPLVTVEREKLDDNTFISIEQALNELPQFMAGGAALGAFGTQTGIGQFTAGNNMDGGAGTGTMFDNTRLPDNGGRIGTFTPGAATVNLRGLGSNRSLLLIDGHRGMPTNGSGVVDLNSVPSAVIGNIEVITGGASAVYGADAMAGVTNIKLRDNYEGLAVRIRGGINEVGDGGEYQFSTVMGTTLAGKGSAMLALQYDKRDVAYYRNRSWYEEAIASPFSNFLNMTFPALGYYTAPTTNLPSQAAVNTVFGNRQCTTGAGVTVPCVTTTGGSGGGAGFAFNDDGTLYTRSSACYLPNYATATTAPASCSAPTTGAIVGATHYFGPQRFKGSLNNSPANPYELTCQYAANQPNHVNQNGVDYSSRSCSPTIGMVDWDRWLSSPREAYNLFGRAKYELNEKLTAYTTLEFSNSNTETRREATPASGGFAAQIPYNASPTAIYLPSVAQTTVVRNGVTVATAGQTLPEYRSVAAGGTNTRGTNCGLNGGCTMQQAFPVSPELAVLLNSRVAGTRPALATNNNAGTNPFQGLSSCINYARNTNPAGAGGAPVFTNPANGVSVTYQVDPNTGQPVYTCGPNAPWAYNTSFDFTNVRGTHNTQRTWNVGFGLQGDLPFSDWTWDLYNSKGEANTQTEFQGFVSLSNYRLLMAQPNYGMGYVNNAGSGKVLSCTSGLSPFTNVPVSQDCIEAVSSNQTDRSGTDQRVHELSAQGHLFEAPAGEVRGAVGVSYRRNAYFYTPDSLRERDYISDTSAGQFGVGSIDAANFNVKEVYGELLIPLLRDLPGIQNLELELGARQSKYSTGPSVPTWKALVSWQPNQWIRARGGYNKAERAPNLAELFTRDSVNANGAITDPCIVPSETTVQNILNGTNTTTLRATLNDSRVNPDFQKLRDLCQAQIEAVGGTASEYALDPANFGRTAGSVPTGVVVVNGSTSLKSEKGQTWTAGVVLSSPFAHPLLSRLSSTIDWYEARIDDPIDIIGAAALTQECFNGFGNNPNYDINNPYCTVSVIERDPVVGGIRYLNTPYLNRGKLVIRGLDASVNWSAGMNDLGLGDDAQGRLSIGIAANFLFDQLQAVTAGGTTRDQVGIGGAAPFQSSTTLGYSWAKNRVSLNWRYRSGTCVGVLGAAGCDNGNSRYGVTNSFSITGGTQIGVVNASLSISNPLNRKPRNGTYDFADPTYGFGTFNPFDDLVGRRYSMNLSMDF